MGLVSFFTFFWISVNFCIAQHHDNVYTEELVIKELGKNFVNAYFGFTTRWNYKKENLMHTDLLSRSLSDLFLHFDINELHISLTNGLWRHEKWGYPIIDAGPGSEVYAYFQKHLSEDEIDSQWKDLNGALSGLLCASFNFVDKSNTFSPEFSLRPQSSVGSDLNSTFLRYSTLPRENVCTENLTPWKKLLPCDSKDGFTSLLNAQSAFSTNYHSLGLHIRKLCIDRKCTNAILESKQTVNLVHDLMLFGGPDWSIRKLFGQGLNGECVLSSSSKIYVDITDKDFEMSPEPHERIVSKRGGSVSNYAVYDIKTISKDRFFNIAVVNKKDKPIPINSSPPLFAKRFLMGTGKERGKIVQQISNTHYSPMNILILENIPWFVPVYLHTLKLTVGDQIIKPEKVIYKPGVQRIRPYHLEVAVKIPARSTLEMSIDFDYIFLKWQEYPPDAHHGHYIGPSIISTILPVAQNYTSIPIEGSIFADSFNASRQGYFLTIHTEALLLNLPTPDFSMPYNVICLACTVVALAFGPLHNLTTKKLTLQRKDQKPKSLITKIKEKLFKKKEVKSESEETEEKAKPEEEESADKPKTE